ncbi:MAG: signal peptidase II [Lachnospiraceae bacterium]|nr:signal peptidase II [Lachnospiraceae bacterium]
MQEKKLITPYYIYDVSVVAVMIFFDQFTKYLCRKKLETGSYVSIIKDVLQLYHFENTGASWGILKGQSILFSVLAAVVSVGLCIFISKIPAVKRFLPLHIASSLVIAGAVGNLIDRIIKGSVTDFIYFVIIRFPIFNVADICIVCASIFMVIMMLFVYKDEELTFLNFSSEKEKDA